MARMNWDKVRIEENGRRYGWERAAETYLQATTKKKAKRKKKKGAKLRFGPKASLARAAVREQKRVAHERQVHVVAEAKAAKAARKAEQQAREAAARAQRRKKLEDRLALDAQRKSDPEYRTKLAMQQARRVKPWMKEVVVVRKKKGRAPIVRKGVQFPPIKSPSSRNDLVE